jgi:hypothetical protein
MAFVLLDSLGLLDHQFLFLRIEAALDCFNIVDDRPYEGQRKAYQNHSLQNENQ